MRARARLTVTRLRPSVRANCSLGTCAYLAAVFLCADADREGDPFLVDELRRRFTPARLAAGLAVTAVVWGWAAAQYPYILPPQVAIAEAAAPRSTQLAMLVSLIAGSVILVPSLVFLYGLFQRTVTVRREP